MIYVGVVSNERYLYSRGVTESRLQGFELLFYSVAFEIFSTASPSLRGIGRRKGQKELPEDPFEDVHVQLMQTYHGIKQQTLSPLTAGWENRK